MERKDYVALSKGTESLRTSRQELLLVAAAHRYSARRLRPQGARRAASSRRARDFRRPATADPPGSRRSDPRRRTSALEQARRYRELAASSRIPRSSAPSRSDREVRRAAAQAGYSGRRSRSSRSSKCSTTCCRGDRRSYRAERIARSPMLPPGAGGLDVAAAARRSLHRRGARAGSARRLLAGADRRTALGSPFPPAGRLRGPHRRVIPTGLAAPETPPALGRRRAIGRVVLATSTTAGEPDRTRRSIATALPGSLCRLDGSTVLYYARPSAAPFARRAAPGRATNGGRSRPDAYRDVRRRAASRRCKPGTPSVSEPSSGRRAAIVFELGLDSALGVHGRPRPRLTDATASLRGPPADDRGACSARAPPDARCRTRSARCDRGGRGG